MRLVRRNFLLAVSLVLLLAGFYLAFTVRLPMPTADWLVTYPLLALGLTVSTGFIDGLNPCAITTLLLFTGALLAITEQTTDESGKKRVRPYIWMVAGAYILGIFLLYFSLGAGFIDITSLRVFGNTHIFTRLAGLLAVVLGLVMVSEYVFPESPFKLAMPTPLHNVAHRWGRKTTVGGAFVGGILIGSCTIPCGGAMYLAVAALIGGLASKTYAYTLLTSYNLTFVLPLILLVGISSSRPVLRGISRLHITHRGLVKFVLGAFVILVGLFALL